MAASNDTLSEQAKAAVAALLLDEPYSQAKQDKGYELPERLADLPLASADVNALSRAVRDRLNASAIVLPDGDDLVRRCVIGALSGHVVLHGPPGTGKTFLARELAEAFGCSFDLVTATPEWTTYDLVGGLRPTVGPNGSEVLMPALGAVSAAALRCGEILAVGGTRPQAHWLVIDELSRADIDKALGPLYTALSGRCAADRTVDLWFENAERRTLVLPERFRIIGTMNDVDTAFVNQLSQGLQRRFQFVHVGVPFADQTAEEVQAAARQAGRWLGRLHRGLEGAALENEAEKLLADERVGALLAQLRELVNFVRWEEKVRWPLGTAQLVDVLRHVALEWHVAKDEDELTDALDAAIADRLLPQASGLDESLFRPLGSWLEEAGLRRSVASLAQIEAPRYS